MLLSFKKVKGACVSGKNFPQQTTQMSDADFDHKPVVQAYGLPKPALAGRLTQPPQYINPQLHADLWLSTVHSARPNRSGSNHHEFCHVSTMTACKSLVRLPD
jgi:hypothetical protein